MAYGDESEWLVKLTMIKLSRPKWVFLTVMAVGFFTLARTQQYYGTIYRGWDAQFYYLLAHSLVFDRDVDVTNNLLRLRGSLSGEISDRSLP